jgi:hypothetical protein
MPAWHLDCVEVTNQTTGEKATFRANCWLDAKAGTATLQLGPSEGAASPPGLYKVTVHTADERGAGTDREISVMLLGSKATSPEITLQSGMGSFERKKVGIPAVPLTGIVVLVRVHCVDLG